MGRERVVKAFGVPRRALATITDEDTKTMGIGLRTAAPISQASRCKHSR
jgi:hypothetical protein